MARIRAFETRLEGLCAEGCVPGTFHSSMGQGAVAAGVAAACLPGDFFVSNHRGHGHLIAKGGETKRLAAELFGRTEGYARGRGGTQHFAAFGVGFMGAMGITGGGIPIATGIGLALKRRGKSDVAVCFLGDGASNQGTFHESLNMAACLGLPVLYVCENNGYAMGTPAAKAVSVVKFNGEIHVRGESYGIPHARVDGNDVAAVREAALAALETVRGNWRPFLLECATYRRRGHSKSDPADYRPEGELEAWSARDPILLARNRLVSEFGVAQDELERIDVDAAAEVESAVAFAESASPGDGKIAIEGVYATPLDPERPDPSREPVTDGAASEMTYREALALALREEMERDERVFLWGEDIGNYDGAFKVTRGFLKEFGPERVIDAPISENAIVGVATGAALAGLRPVAEIMFMDFVLLALDQLGNHAAKLRYLFGEQARVPLVVRTPAGGYRGYGATHSQSLQALVCHMPGLKVVAPSTPREARGMLKSAIRDDDPVVFVEHKLLYGEKGLVPEAEELVPLGRANVAREGKDVTIVAHSYMTKLALEAADALAEAGADAEVVDLRSLKPLDWETVVASAKKTQRVVVVEEGHRFCGVGAEVAAELGERAFGYLDAPVVRVAAADFPIPTGPEMERAVLPSGQDIIRAAEAVLSGGGGG
jgi:2-oxoisovalerate dehydrogenase E1 component